MLRASRGVSVTAELLVKHVVAAVVGLQLRTNETISCMHSHGILKHLVKMSVTV